MNGPKQVLDWPEDYLWVRHPGGYSTVIDEARLHALQDGAAPEDEAEQLLVDNPKWLHTYLRHVIHQFPITITPSKPLPEWNPAWIEKMDDL
jgi:hypothetical protein